jgi:hypothetical protein
MPYQGRYDVVPAFFNSKSKIGVVPGGTICGTTVVRFCNKPLGRLHFLHAENGTTAQTADSYAAVWVAVPYRLRTLRGRGGTVVKVPWAAGWIGGERGKKSLCCTGKPCGAHPKHLT